MTAKDAADVPAGGEHARANPAGPAPTQKDSLARIFRDGILTTGRKHFKTLKSGGTVFHKRITKERIEGDERREVEEHIHQVGACGHHLTATLYTIADGRKICSQKCAARCEFSRCQREVPERELVRVGKLRVCPRCLLKCRIFETVTKSAKAFLQWADRTNG